MGANAPADSADSLARQLATITTDTGAFAPGHRDFSHYDTPSLCRAAARVARASFQTSVAAQAIGDTLSEDTIGVGGTALVARACGSRFTLANTDRRDLGDLFDLALHEQNDTLTQRTLDKLAAQARNPNDRTDTWSSGMHSYLAFGRLAAAEALLRQIDASDLSDRTLQVELHRLVGNYFGRAGDTVRYHQELARMVTLGGQLARKDIGYPYVRMGYKGLMRLMALEHLDSIPSLARLAQHDLSQYSKADQVTTPLDRFVDWGHIPLDSVIEELAPEWYTYRRQHGAAPAPRLQADYWFPPPGRPKSDTIRPVQGKINLMCQGGMPTDYWQNVFNHIPLFSAYQQAAHIKRWLEEYGAAGLEVTIVRSAPGYTILDFQNLNTWRLFTASTEEAQLWRWYAQDYEQLPVTVAVQVKKTEAWLPSPDGRRWQDAKTQFPMYFAGLVRDYGPNVGEEPGSCTIIGRNGSVLYSTAGGGSRMGNDVDVVLKWLFRGPGAAIDLPLKAPSSPAVSRLSSGIPAPALRDTTP